MSLEDEVRSEWLPANLAGRNVAEWPRRVEAEQFIQTPQNFHSSLYNMISLHDAFWYAGRRRKKLFEVE
jgi:hypothetical protein